MYYKKNELNKNSIYFNIFLMAFDFTKVDSISKSEIRVLTTLKLMLEFSFSCSANLTCTPNLNKGNQCQAL